jgi:hypothetical protein
MSRRVNSATACKVAPRAIQIAEDMKAFSRRFSSHFTQPSSLISPKASRFSKGDRGSGFLGFPRQFREFIRSISTDREAGIGTNAQALAAHKFTGRPDFSTGDASLPPAEAFRRNQFPPRRNRFRLSTKTAGNSRYAALPALVQQWGSIMFVFLNMLYRAYCRARLLEMRRQYLAN